MATSNCEPCTERYKQITAVQWCIDCEEKLCSECAENHKVQKVSRHHHLVASDKIPQKLDIKSSCQKHGNLQFEYFCIDHDALCCKECLVDAHRTCKKITSIEIASVNALLSQSYVDSIQQINYLLKSMKSFCDNRKANKVTLETDGIEIRTTIRNVKQRIIKHLDILEASLLAELEQTEDKNVAKINEDIDTVENILVKTREYHSSFGFIKDEGTDKQAFLLFHTSKLLLDDIEDKVNSMTRNAMEIKLRFSDTQLEKSMMALGSINMTATPYTAPVVSHKYRQSQIAVDTEQRLTTFKFQHDINLKQKHDAIILGMTVTDDNLLLLCDIYGKQIHICEENDAYRMSVDLKYPPCDIAAIPSTTTAVVSGFDPYIQFIDINSQTMLRTINIPESEWGGISTTKDNILVGGKCKIFLLDHQGNTLKTIHPNVNPNKTIWYICVGSNDLIHFTNGEGLYCTTLHGNKVSSYNSRDLFLTRKVAIDKGGNVYVVGESSNNIHKLSSDGKFTEIVLSSNEGLKHPYALCYNKDYTKLYVANMSGRTVLVFKVNKIK